MPTHAVEEIDPHENTHLSVIEGCMILDTIEEAKENSSLSGESEENIPEVVQKKDSFPEPPQISKDQEREKKITVQWMSEDEDETDIDDETDAAGVESMQFLKHPDIDRGWAWVVLFATFLIFCFTAGLLGSVGLYYVQMLHEFKKSRSYTAWMGSLMNAFYMLAGPVASVIIKNCGCRSAIILGGIIMTIGFLLSSIAQSLPFIFLTYGVVVATGMNFVYSGQIISLVQYFHERHAMATSLSMAGIGVGMFSMIRILDIIIVDYGWRNSFVFCAGFSLQVCALGMLVFPIKPLKIEKYSSSEEAKKKCLSEESLPTSPIPLGKILLYRKSLLNRSVSSLRLSIGGGYLSSSLANIDGELKSVHGTFSSNQHSFSSRGSQYLGSGMRSSQHSFSQFPYGDFPVGLLPFLKSNQHSFCSRGSSYGIHSLKSNPQSFSNKNSQVDLPHIAYHHCLPALKDSGSDMSVSRDIKEEKESLSASEFKLAYSGLSKKSDAEAISRCNLLYKKVEGALKGIISGWCLELFLDPCFLLLNIAIFFTMLGTVKIFVIYKDFSESLGVEDYYSSAMSIMGIGDIFGRISAGVLSSCSWSNPTIIYSIALILCGVVIGLHSIANWGPMFLLLAGLFGFCYGQQNVLITLSPSSLLGKEKMVTVFGYVLFSGGLSALIGAPLAGYIVDCTGSYNGVVILSVSSCIVAGICMLCCYIIDVRKKASHFQKDVSSFV